MEEKDFTQLYEARRPRYEAAQENLVAGLKSVVKSLATARAGSPAVRCKVTDAGIKSLKSTFKKAQDQSPGFEGDEAFARIHDIARASIVCNNLNEVDLVINASRKRAKGVLFACLDI